MHTYHPPDFRREFLCEGVPDGELPEPFNSGLVYEGSQALRTVPCVTKTLITDLVADHTGVIWCANQIWYANKHAAAVAKSVRECEPASIDRQVHADSRTVQSVSVHASSSTLGTWTRPNRG